MPRPKPGKPVATKEQLRNRRPVAEKEAPTRRMTKEERDTRNDSVILGSDAFEQRKLSKQKQLVKRTQFDDASAPFWDRVGKVTCVYLHERLEALDALSDPYMERWFHSPIWAWIFGQHNPQKLLLNVTVLLLVVFASWILGDYLLAKSRTSAACTPSTSTVYVPYLQTVTSTITASSTISGSTSNPSGSPIGAALAGTSTTSSNSYTTISTFTTTISHTTTVTEPLPTTDVTVLSSSGGPSYFFYVTSGSTVWQNGVSPSSGASLTVATTSVYVIPAQSQPPTAVSTPTSWTTVTSTSIIKQYTTITLPPYTSTVFSVMSPALTTTLTSTHYTTYSLSAVSSRSSFSGMNSEGWNASSTDAPVVPASTAAPRVTKFTRLVYFGHDNITTSTSTMLVTATLGDAVTNTLFPPSNPTAPSSPGGATPDTTLTAQGITLTQTLDDASSFFSTSLSFSVNGPVLGTSSPVTVPGSGSTASGTAPISSASTNLAGVSSAVSSGRVSMLGTSDLLSEAAATGSGSLSSTSPTSYGQPLGGSATNGSAASNSSSASLYTITSFLSGRGTVFTLTSTPSLITPRVTVVNGTTTQVVSSSNTLAPVTGGSLGEANSLSTSSGSTIYQGGRPGTRSLPTSSSAQVSTTTLTIGADGSSSISVAAVGTSTPAPVASDSATASTTSISGQDTLIPLVSELSGSLASTAPLSDSSMGTAAPETFTESESASGTSITSLTTTTQDLSSAQSSLTSLRSSNSSSLTLPTASRSSSFSNPFPPTSATAIPTQGCGEQGDFTMDFDTLPTFNSGSARKFKRQQSWNGTAGGNGTSDITEQPILSMRPYKHMLFSGGYVYAPQPVEPFAPASSPNVAVFLANGTGLRAGQKPNGLEPGEIADGPYHEGDPAFFFDAKSAQLGCDNAGPDECTMEVTPYVWNSTVKDDVPAPAQNFTIPPCIGYQNCTLTEVSFPPTFRNLSGIRIRAIRDQQPRMFFADDIKMRWSDDSCRSGLRRQESP